MAKNISQMYGFHYLRMHNFIILINSVITLMYQWITNSELKQNET